MTTFFARFESVADIRLEFGDGPPDGSEVLFAWYSVPSYDGSALVVYTHNGKIFEVHGKHCSCYGLEDQWDPEETTIKALRSRYADALRAGLGPDDDDDDDRTIEAGGYEFDPPAAKALLALLTKEIATP